MEARAPGAYNLKVLLRLESIRNPCFASSSSQAMEGHMSPEHLMGRFWWVLEHWPALGVQRAVPHPNLSWECLQGPLRPRVVTTTPPWPPHHSPRSKNCTDSEGLGSPQ